MKGVNGKSERGDSFKRVRQQKRSRKRLLVLLTVMALLWIVWQLPQVRHIYTKLLHWIEASGPLAPLLYIGLYVLACVCLVPGSVFILGSGLLFGLFYGTVLSWVAAIATASVAFWLGRLGLRRILSNGWQENRYWRVIEQAVEDQGFRIALLSRISPFFPFPILNYLFGISRIRWSDYLFGSMLGEIPSTFFYVYLGAGARLAIGTEGVSPLKWVLYTVGLGATLWVTWYLTRIARQEFAFAQDDRRLFPSQKSQTSES